MKKKKRKKKTITHSLEYFQIYHICLSYHHRMQSSQKHRQCRKIRAESQIYKASRTSSKLWPLTHVLFTFIITLTSTEQQPKNNTNACSCVLKLLLYLSAFHIKIIRIPAEAACKQSQRNVGVVLWACMASG